jgi:hypothetical protein
LVAARSSADGSATLGAFFFAENPSVSAGSVLVSVAIAGQPLLAFNDLAYNQGGQDRAFATTGNQGTWPWQGVFTVNEGGTLTRWDITVTGSSTGDCNVVYARGGGAVFIQHP